MKILILLVGIALLICSTRIVIKAILFKPVADSKSLTLDKNVLGQKAIRLLESSENLDPYYSPILRSSVEQAQAQRRWRNYRQRLLRLARNEGIIEKRLPSYLASLKIRWKGLRTFYTEEIAREEKRLQQGKKQPETPPSFFKPTIKKSGR